MSVGRRRRFFTPSHAQPEAPVCFLTPSHAQPEEKANRGLARSEGGRTQAGGVASERGRVLATGRCIMMARTTSFTSNRPTGQSCQCYKNIRYPSVLKHFMLVAWALGDPVASPVIAITRVCSGSKQQSWKRYCLCRTRARSEIEILAPKPRWLICHSPPNFIGKNG